MKYRLLPMVETDLAESVDRYFLQQPGLEEKFLHEVDRTFEKIVLNPLLYAVKRKHKGIQLRTVLLDIFPYLIVYFIDESKSIVVIAAVWHTSRNPKILKKRLV